MRTDVTASEALRLILEATPVLAPETVAFPEALSRVLAEAVVAGRDLPPASNSAMDGYAVRAADLAGASPRAPGPAARRLRGRGRRRGDARASARARPRAS